MQGNGYAPKKILIRRPVCAMFRAVRAVEHRDPVELVFSVWGMEQCLSSKVWCLLLAHFAPDALQAVGYGPLGVEYEPWTSAEKVLLLGSGAAVIASCAVAFHMALATKRYLHRKMPSWKGPWAARWE